MSAAHVEALAFTGLAAFFFLLSYLALRLRMRTGRRNGWLWAGLIVGVFALLLVVLNLNGVVIGGVAGTGTHRASGPAPARSGPEEPASHGERLAKGLETTAAQLHSGSRPS